MMILLTTVALAATPPLEARIDARLPAWRALYEQLHAHPELSEHEVETARRVAGRLRDLGIEVTEGFGRYEDGRQARGVVGVLRNGKGPTILLRTDLDALPIEERTGLPYASHVKAKDARGEEVPVMHACGHDLHMTVFLATAEMLAATRDRWAGTILFVGQPAEEVGTGSRALLSAGLYERFGKPDFALAWHTAPDLEAGTVGVVEGWALANVDSVDITVRGVGGHGAYPQKTKDPVVLAAQLVVGLQTLVSRETSPLDPAVVTVGSIHGGTKHNIIPDEVKLQLTVRSYGPEVRRALLDGIAREAKGLAVAAGIPADRMPVVKVREEEFTPSTYNDPELVGRVAALWRERLGGAHVVTGKPVMGGEDFSRYHEGGVPAALFWLGSVAPERYARRAEVPLPPLHSSELAPDAGLAIRTGVRAMTEAIWMLSTQPVAPHDGPRASVGSGSARRR